MGNYTSYASHSYLSPCPPLDELYAKHDKGFRPTLQTTEQLVNFLEDRRRHGLPFEEVHIEAFRALMWTRKNFEDSKQKGAKKKLKRELKQHLTVSGNGDNAAATCIFKELWKAINGVWVGDKLFATRPCGEMELEGLAELAEQQGINLGCRLEGDMFNEKMTKFISDSYTFEDTNFMVFLWPQSLLLGRAGAMIGAVHYQVLLARLQDGGDFVPNTPVLRLHLCTTEFTPTSEACWYLASDVLAMSYFKTSVVHQCERLGTWRGDIHSLHRATKCAGLMFKKRCDGMFHPFKNNCKDLADDLVVALENFASSILSDALFRAVRNNDSNV